MGKEKVKDVAIRSLKTFWQAAIGYALAAITTAGITDINAMKAVIGGVIASSIAAGASAAWNGVVKPLLTGGTNNEQDK